jgi:protein SCO1
MVKSLKPMLFAILALSLCFAACETEPSRLPIFGNRDVVNGDTIYRSIPDFSFVNQDSQVVNNATFAGKAYVVDFFFIHCPTICPKVKASAKRVYDRYKSDDRLVLLSHTIDVKNDTVAALKAYANKLGIETKKWNLVTGDHDQIYEIADDYFSVAKEDSEAPGGFDHSGLLILVDAQRHVRASVDGTLPDSIPSFFKKVDLLLKEMDDEAKIKQK